MATLGNRQGVRYLQWEEPDGRRKTVGLGRMPAKAAESVRAHVDQILVARAANQPMPPETARWLGGMEGKLRKKLEAAGLVAAAGEKPATRLIDFLDGYIKRRTDLKPNTIENLTQTRDSLMRFFGNDRILPAISRAEAKDWQRHALQHYAPATVATLVKKARQMFQDAVDRRILSENPFAKLKAGSFVNAARTVYVPAADVLKVIDACPDAEWRLVFALARFAGCRVPSEIREMKWADWNCTVGMGRLVVRSPKTEHQGKGQRVVPVSAEVEKAMIDQLNAAPEGEHYALPRLRLVSNLATTGRKIVERAGLVPWPRLFQNLRASCETDWAANHPIHVAAAWSGNTQAVAVRHYLSVTEADFEKAARRAAPGAADSGGQARPDADGATENAVEARTKAISVPPRGIEPYPESPEILQVTHLALRRALRSHQKTLARLTAPAPRPLRPRASQAEREGQA